MISPQIYQPVSPAINLINLTPPEPSNLTVGTTTQFRAVANFFQFPNPDFQRDVTNEVEWVSSDPTILTFNQTPGQGGQATLLKEGPVQIGAWSEPSKFWVTMEVEVGPAGGVGHFGELKHIPQKRFKGGALWLVHRAWECSAVTRLARGRSASMPADGGLKIGFPDKPVSARNSPPRH